MVLWGAVQNLIRPVSARHLLPFSNSLHHEASSLRGMLFLNGSTSRVQPTYLFGAIQSFSLGVRFSTSTAGASFSSLTDTRFPKRRPGTKLRKKRASLKPPGPFAWVQYVPGEPIPRSQPNEGTVQGSKEKKRIKQRKAFILVCFDVSRNRPESKHCSNVPGPLRGLTRRSPGLALQDHGPILCEPRYSDLDDGRPPTRMIADLNQDNGRPPTRMTADLRPG